jgi:hypothetical protein
VSYFQVSLNGGTNNVMGGIKPTIFTEMQLNQQFALVKVILDEEKHQKFSS